MCDPQSRREVYICYIPPPSVLCFHILLSDNDSAVIFQVILSLLCPPKSEVEHSEYASIYRDVLAARLRIEQASRSCPNTFLAWPYGQCKALLSPG